MRWDILLICRGGSRSVTVPVVRFAGAAKVPIGRSAPHKLSALILIGCDWARLRRRQR